MPAKKQPVIVKAKRSTAPAALAPLTAPTTSSSSSDVSVVENYRYRLRVRLSNIYPKVNNTSADEKVMTDFSTEFRSVALHQALSHCTDEKAKVELRSSIKTSRTAARQKLDQTIATSPVALGSRLSWEKNIICSLSTLSERARTAKNCAELAKIESDLAKEEKNFASKETADAAFKAYSDAQKTAAPVATAATATTTSSSTTASLKAMTATSTTAPTATSSTASTNGDSKEEKVTGKRKREEDDDSVKPPETKKHQPDPVMMLMKQRLLTYIQSGLKKLTEESSLSQHNKPYLTCLEKKEIKRANDIKAEGEQALSKFAPFMQGQLQLELEAIANLHAEQATVKNALDGLVLKKAEDDIRTIYNNLTVATDFEAPSLPQSFAPVVNNTSSQFQSSQQQTDSATAATATLNLLANGL